MPTICCRPACAKVRCDCFRGDCRRGRSAHRSLGETAAACRRRCCWRSGTWSGRARVNILGYIHGQFGLAEAARSARALIEQGVPVALRDIDLGLPNARDDHALDAYLDDTMPHAVTIIFVNPDYLAQALASISLAAGRGATSSPAGSGSLNACLTAGCRRELVDEVMVATGFVEGRGSCYS